MVLAHLTLTLTLVPAGYTVLSAARGLIPGKLMSPVSDAGRRALAREKYNAGHSV